MSYIKSPNIPDPPNIHLDDMPKKAKAITQRTLSGLFWLASGSGIRAVLRIAVLVILARLLTPLEFGLVGVAVVVVPFSHPIFSVGIWSGDYSTAKS